MQLTGLTRETDWTLNSENSCPVGWTSLWVCPMSYLVGLTWRCVSYVLPGRSDVAVCVLCLAWSV